MHSQRERNSASLYGFPFTRKDHENELQHEVNTLKKKVTLFLFSQNGNSEGVRYSNPLSVLTGKKRIILRDKNSDIFGAN